MNKQREIIYGERRKILEGTDTRTNFISMVEHVVATDVPAYCEGRHREAWDFEGLWTQMRMLAAGLPPFSEVSMDSLGNSVEEVSETLSGELIGLYEEKEQEYGAELLREVEQSVMLQVIDSRWLTYLTQMDHLREGMGLQAYGQMDPLVEYKAAAFTAFQDLTEDIQREIVRALLNVQIRRVDPNEADPAVAGATPETAPAIPAPTAGAAEATAPPSPRADRPGGAVDAAQVPPARPAAALASGALARATGTRVSTPLVTKPIVRNIVESSSAGTRRADGNGNGAGNGANGAPQGKVGRNQACPCGSGKKYKFCHGR